jgi:hypothetical protein
MFWDHPHAVALLDSQGLIICNNPAFRGLIGSISDAIAGNSFLTLFPPFEADRVMVYPTASLRFAIRPDLVTRITLPDGTSVDVVLTLIPAQACGHAGLFVVVRRFGRQNGLTHPSACVGKNYLTVCNEAVGSYAEASEVTAGLWTDTLPPLIEPATCSGFAPPSIANAAGKAS